jgi:spermidine/putrescine ABC transporter ATP-binding subunit
MPEMTATVAPTQQIARVGAGDVELRDVVKRFGDHAAVDGVSLVVRQGEFLTLLGPSGCGKTTTLNMIAGFVEPDDGAVILGGRDVTRVPPEKRQSAMVFQQYALFPHMTVAQNVAFGLRMRRVNKRERDERVKDMLHIVGLDGLGDRYPQQLSGGQQQRVALARASVVRPTVLLLDEPLSNLDLKLREQLRAEIRTLQQEVGITTVFVTHDQTEALMLSDRIAVMNRGRIEQLGTPSEIYQRPASPFVAGFVGQSNLLDAEALCDELSGSVVVRLAGDQHVRALAPHGKPAADRHRKLLIRPEALQLSSVAERQHPSTERNTLTGHVKDVIFLGAESHIVAELAGGVRLTAILSAVKGSSLPPVGTQVTFTAAVEDCLLLST